MKKIKTYHMENDHYIQTSDDRTNNNSKNKKYVQFGFDDVTCYIIFTFRCVLGSNVSVLVYDLCFVGEP